MKFPVLPLVGSAALLVSIPSGFAVTPNESNLLGKQSQNSGLPAVPVTRPVAIDGNLAEWDLTGRMWSFADLGMRDQYSVETAAMWDGEYLYLALQWRDPTPLFNQINPKTNPADGWKADSFQMRIKSDHVAWVTAWHYTAEGTANLVIDRLKNPENDREGKDSIGYFGKPGSADLGQGVQMAFLKT